MAWVHESIKTLAEQQPGWVVECEGDCLSISNDEGVDAFLYAGASQLIVEAPLFSLSAVKDTASLNELILRTHQLLPLSTIGIKSIGGEEYYTAFGSLSVNSKESVVIEEVETLFANIDEFLELYVEHLNEEVA